MIAILDYGLGNVRAFANIYKALDIPHMIVSSAGGLAGASRIILPGVGAFDQAMRRLNERGLRAPVEGMVARGAALLGVCVGMQMLMDSSEEGEDAGLGLIRGRSLKFRQNGDNPIPVPHMGWNEVAARPGSPLFAGVEAGERFYFLHTYHVQCDDPGDVLATSDYPDSFACAVRRANIWGVQFHPEKSHAGGVTLLKNFAESC